jgi:hypothetical protein
MQLRIHFYYDSLQDLLNKLTEACIIVVIGEDIVVDDDRYGRSLQFLISYEDIKRG